LSLLSFRELQKEILKMSYDERKTDSVSTGFRVNESASIDQLPVLWYLACIFTVLRHYITSEEYQRLLHPRMKFSKAPILEKCSSKWPQKRSHSVLNGLSYFFIS
jgi:hypothetical protein